MNFKISSDFEPRGDQPKAINSLTEGLSNNEKYQVLLGETGSGKTFTMANVIKNKNKPTLIISHNKTLAAQLYGELKSFFQIILLSILYHIMTTINLRHISHQLMYILRKIYQLTNKLKN